MRCENVTTHSLTFVTTKQILQLSEDLQAIGLEVLAEVHPWTKVVNSIVVLRVMER